MDVKPVVSVESGLRFLSADVALPKAGGETRGGGNDTDCGRSLGFFNDGVAVFPEHGLLESACSRCYSRVAKSLYFRH